MRAPPQGMRWSTPDLIFRWAGWEAPIRQLADAGWTFKTQEELIYRSHRLVFRHEEMKAYGITSPIEEQLMQESSFHGIPIYCNVRLAENILLNSMGPPIRDASYSQIDVSHPLSYRENLRDVFDYVQTDSGLLIPEDDVPDLLERILNLQEPARQERIKERVKGQQKEFLTISAKIIQFGK